MIDIKVQEKRDRRLFESLVRKYGAMEVESVMQKYKHLYKPVKKVNESKFDNFDDDTEIILID